MKGEKLILVLSVVLFVFPSTKNFRRTKDYVPLFKYIREVEIDADTTGLANCI